MKGGTNVINRITHKHTPTLNEPAEETGATRGMRKADSVDCLEGQLIDEERVEFSIFCFSKERSPKPSRSATTSNSSKDPRLLAANPSKGPAPTSPKPPPAASWRRSVLLPSSTDVEIAAKPAETVYNNFPVLGAAKKNETASADEEDGDSIAKDLLNIVQQEERKEQQRVATAKPRPTGAPQENNFDLDVEPAAKLVHPGKDRPRRANVSRPARRATNEGVSRDSSSDGGLDIDEPSSAEPAETSNNDNSSRVVTRVLKSALKPTDSSALPPPVPAKLQARPSVPLPGASRPNPLAATSEPFSLTNSDVTHDSLTTRTSLMPSSLTSLQSSHRDENHPTSDANIAVGSTPPPVSARPSKAAIGTRVLPVLDSNGDPPASRLRYLPTAEKKGDENRFVPRAGGVLAEPPPISETHSASADPSGTSNDQSEDYKRTFSFLLFYRT